MLPVGSTNGSRERVPTLARSGASTTHTSNKGRISALGSFATGSSEQQVRPCPRCRRSGGKLRILAVAVICLCGCIALPSDLSKGDKVRLRKVLGRTVSLVAWRGPRAPCYTSPGGGAGTVAPSLTMVAKATPKFPGKPAPRPYPAPSASRFLDQEANETHRRLFGRRDSHRVGGRQQRAALLQMLKRSQGSNIQHRDLVPIPAEGSRHILLPTP